MANTSPNNEGRRYGLFPDPTLPMLPQPPESLIHAAMRDVAAFLAEVQTDIAELGGYPLHFLGGELAERGHREPAEQWAIHRHVVAGRLELSDGLTEIAKCKNSHPATTGKSKVYRAGAGALVKPTDALWQWWRDQSEAPHAAYLETLSAGETEAGAATPLNKKADTLHSADFRSVRWFGTKHSFTENQATCVKLLWEAWGQGTPDVGNETLLQAVDRESPPRSLRDLFRNNAAWGTMVVEGGSKGSHRLAEPEKKL